MFICKRADRGGNDYFSVNGVGLGVKFANGYMFACKAMTLDVNCSWCERMCIGCE